jgi:hypothetical protein
MKYSKLSRADYIKQYYADNKDWLTLRQVYYNMMARCLNPNHKHYADYGGRGITVCDRWSGENGRDIFLADMGPRPEGYVLDRLNNDQGYSPENCAWVTWLESQRNRRTSIYMYIDGKRKHYADVANDNGLIPSTLLSRMKNGWPKDKLLQPARPRKPNKKHK